MNPAKVIMNFSGIFDLTLNIIALTFGVGVELAFLTVIIFGVRAVYRTLKDD